jgi:hypothetical protein
MIMYNLDDCFIIAKGMNQMDELLNAILNAKDKNDEILESFYFLDDVLPYYTLDELKELAKVTYDEYK